MFIIIGEGAVIGSSKGNRFKFISKTAMAEGTRLRALDERVHSLEQNVQELATRSNKRFEELYLKMEAMRTEDRNHYEALRKDSAMTTKKMEQLMEVIMKQHQVSPSKESSGSLPQERGILPNPSISVREEGSSYQVHTRNNQSSPLPRLEFPHFNGDNPKNWIRNVKSTLRSLGLRSSRSWK